MPKLAQWNLCTGCTACAAACPEGCIAMKADGDGFRYPVVEESKCTGCGRCERACPVLNPPELTHTPTAWAAWSADADSRRKSTSGGVFPELARGILEQGGVVYGAAYDDRFRVMHIRAENEGQLDRLRGAKYAQSDLSGVFSDARARLEKGQQVLFSGTPCQVLGLKTYLRRAYDNLLTVDLVCHSVPSPLAWEKYLEYISSGKDLAAVNLRCKDTGWSRYRYSNRFDFSDGSCRMEACRESLYMQLFGGGYISRPSCANCPARGCARTSDLTLGDFWGIWDTYPELDDDKGISLVLAQTGKGLAALADIHKRSVALEEAVRENPAVVHSAVPDPRVQQVMGSVREGQFEEVKKLLEFPVSHEKTGLLNRGMRFFRRKLRNAVFRE